jgi:hypothetical protein
MDEGGGGVLDQGSSQVLSEDNLFAVATPGPAVPPNLPANRTHISGH